MSNNADEKLLVDILPEFADELRRLLAVSEKPHLAKQVDKLSIIDRDRCGDSICASFYTAPKPDGPYGTGHENIELEPDEGMIILDVVNNSIVFVEVLYRDDIRDKLVLAIP